MNRETCPDCDSTKVYQDQKYGEIVCSDCGLVVAEKYTDRRPPHGKNNNNDENNSSQQFGLPSSILKQGEGKGSVFSYEESKNNKRGKFRRLHNYNIRGKQDENEPSTLQRVRVEVKRLSNILNLPKYIQKRVVDLYKDLSEQGSVRGRGMDTMIAGCVYTACREHDMLRTIEEISELCPVRKEKILDAYKKIKKDLDINEGHIKCTEYVTKFCNEFNLTTQEKERVREIIEEVRDEMTGKNPKGIVGSSIYVSALESDNERRFSQRHIANVVGVTDVTIRNRFREIAEILGLEREELLD